MVDVQFVRMMKRFIPLAQLKTHHEAHKATGGPLKSLALFTHQRLSVQPLTPGESGPYTYYPHTRMAVWIHIYSFNLGTVFNLSESVCSPATSSWEEICPELLFIMYPVPNKYGA